MTATTNYDAEIGDSFDRGDIEGGRLGVKDQPDRHRGEDGNVDDPVTLWHCR